MNIQIEKLEVSISPNKDGSESEIFTLREGEKHPMLIDFILSVLDSNKEPRQVELLLENKSGNTTQISRFEMNFTDMKKTHQSGHCFTFKGSGNRLYPQEKGPLLSISAKVQIPFKKI